MLGRRDAFRWVTGAWDVLIVPDPAALARYRQTLVEDAPERTIVQEGHFFVRTSPAHGAISEGQRR